MHSSIIIIALTFFIFNCQNKDTASTKVGASYENTTSIKHPHYDFEEPSRRYEMPDELEEISGLSLDASGQFFLAVQDEDGLVFYIDRADGQVKQKIDFWKDGDYEGIESVKDKIYVIKSTGTIYEISDAGSDQQKVEKYNFFLNDDNDVEGLAYLPQRNALLLACKARAGYDDENYLYQKAIYEFDLGGKKLLEEPFLLISQDAIHDYLDTSPAVRKLEKVIEFFQPNDNEFSFSPSAIAVHPISGQLYITSAVGKYLLITDLEGKVLHIENLKKSIHPQPEGLCFDPQGNLFIANEGKGGENGVIYQYNYKP